MNFPWLAKKKFKHSCVAVSNKCGYKNSNEERICISDSDCEEGTNTKGSCNKMTNAVFKKKGIYHIGTCSNSSQLEKTAWCVDPQYVGEKKLSNVPAGKQTSLDDMAEDGSTSTPPYQGISLNQPQCLKLINEREPLCKHYNAGSAPWFCDPTGSMGCNYIDGSTLESCPEKPPNSLNSQVEWEPTCCDTGNESIQGNFHFCCPVKVKEDPITKEKLCLNTSKYVPDQKWLGVSSNEEYSCTEDAECYKFRDKLNSKLQSQSTSIKENNYADLYCDKTEHVCKFFAGYVDQLVSANEEGIDSHNKYIMGNNDSISKSEALPVGDSGLVWTLPTFLDAPESTEEWPDGVSFVNATRWGTASMNRLYLAYMIHRSATKRSYTVYYTSDDRFRRNEIGE